MIHFTCDACNRPIELDHEVRYVVRVEVFAAMDEEDRCCPEDRDHLQEIDDLLYDEEELREACCQQARFDLCEECQRKFLRDPLGQQVSPPPRSVQLGFSKN